MKSFLLLLLCVVAVSALNPSTACTNEWDSKAAEIAVCQVPFDQANADCVAASKAGSISSLECKSTLGALEECCTMGPVCELTYTHGEHDHVSVYHICSSEICADEQNPDDQDFLAENFKPMLCPDPENCKAEISCYFDIGSIMAIVVGGLVMISVSVGIIIYCKRKKTAKNEKAPESLHDMVADDKEADARQAW